MTRPPGSHPGPRPAHALLVSLPPFRFAALFPVCACVVVSRTDGLCSGLSCCHAMQQRHRAQGSPGLRLLKPTTASPSNSNPRVGLLCWRRAGLGKKQTCLLLEEAPSNGLLPHSTDRLQAAVFIRAHTELT